MTGKRSATNAQARAARPDARGNHRDGPPGGGSTAASPAVAPAPSPKSRTSTPCARRRSRRRCDARRYAGVRHARRWGPGEGPLAAPPPRVPVAALVGLSLLLGASVVGILVGTGTIALSSGPPEPRCPRRRRRPSPRRRRRPRPPPPTAPRRGDDHGRCPPLSSRPGPCRRRRGPCPPTAPRPRRTPTPARRRSCSPRRCPPGLPTAFPSGFPLPAGFPSTFPAAFPRFPGWPSLPVPPPPPKQAAPSALRATESPRAVSSSSPNRCTSSPTGGPRLCGRRVAGWRSRWWRSSGCSRSCSRAGERCGRASAPAAPRWRAWCAALAWEAIARRRARDPARLLRGPGRRVDAVRVDRALRALAFVGPDGEVRADGGSRSTSRDFTSERALAELPSGADPRARRPPRRAR